MKKPLTLAFTAALALCASAASIAVRDVSFPADEIPATNPRIERRADVITHIEVFTPFAFAPDGSASAKVAETSCDMDSAAAAMWIREAKAALGIASPVVYSKYKAYGALSEIGAWPQVKQYLEANDLWDAFIIANEFSADDPRFTAGLAALQQLLGISDADLAAILSRCIAN